MNLERSRNENSHDDHSVSQYIEGLKTGDEEATQKIWERFLDRLIRLADGKLKTNRKAMDEEDVVQNAFAQFFQQVQKGRFSKLDDRNDLWQILAMLVDRRAKDQDRQQTTQKAGKGQVRTESVFLKKCDLSNALGIAGVPEMAPTPEMAAELTEVFRNRLAGLNDEWTEQLVLLKMQGFTNTEIARKLESSDRTVERRLAAIRSKWRASLDDESD